MEQVKWFERDFSFRPQQNIFPAILERLAGTPARLEEKLNALPAAVLTSRLGDTWTVQENAGHLTDLEPLWQGRLEDILGGEVELRPTDLQNTTTNLANHHATPIGKLLTDFRQIRAQTMRALAALGEADIAKSALHPRLKTPMRTLDLFLFVAEHDDHHLARISELARAFRQ